ncbi:MAG: DUF1992 domain-containing protein, partial [Actinobacteria bacterium]|nr:DUF1992 domain-containing protein [Actinomycetota bacterium]
GAEDPDRPAGVGPLVPTLGTSRAQPGMTEKKAAGVSWESWIERKIRESMEQGEFDNLPGSGEPIPELARPYDELWWLRKKLREEQLSIDPPALVLRRDYHDTLAKIADARSEGEVRRLVAAINERIVYVNSHTTFGPPTELVPLNVERVVAEWRDAQAARGEGGSAGGSAG